MRYDPAQINSFDLTRYPDYRGDLPPDVYQLHRFGHLDEYEAEWGRRWGANGIGRLRDVALSRPTEYEVLDLWLNHPKFFLLRYTNKIDVDALIRNHEDYEKLLRTLGIDVHWIEYDHPMGAYGPMRKLFMCAEVKVVAGGAIISRWGQASFKRGLARPFTKFLVGMDCPILHTVHGRAVCELGPMGLPIAEDTWIMGTSNCATAEGWAQVRPTLEEAGIKHLVPMPLQIIRDEFENGGEFHTDMVIAAVKERTVLIYPAFTPWETYQWLRDHEFTIIEVPREEHYRFTPENLLILEPGKVIVNAGARETIKRLEAEKVEVIPFDCHGIMQGGVNGMRCITLEMRRDEGPYLER